jgi:hypothetical protein
MPNYLLYHTFCLPVLDTLGQIGQLLTGLGVKTMAEQWKGYARLAFQYVEHLKPHLDVAGPLRFLAADVSHSLQRVIEMVSIILTVYDSLLYGIYLKSRYWSMSCCC